MLVKDNSEPRDWIVIYKGFEERAARQIAINTSTLSPVEEVLLFNAKLEARWAPECHFPDNDHDREGRAS